LTTVMEATSKLIRSEEGMIAVSCVDETNVVVRWLLLNSTIELAVKFVPFTVMVKPAPFTYADVGEMEIMVGAGGFCTVKTWPPEVPPPGEGFVTVIDAVCKFDISEDGMTAVNVVLETNVVVRELLFHFTTELGTKFVPVTVRVKPAPPTFA